LGGPGVSITLTRRRAPSRISPPEAPGQRGSVGLRPPGPRPPEDGPTTPCGDSWGATYRHASRISVPACRLCISCANDMTGRRHRDTNARRAKKRVTPPSGAFARSSDRRCHFDTTRDRAVRSCSSSSRIRDRAQHRVSVRETPGPPNSLTRMPASRHAGRGEVAGPTRLSSAKRASYAQEQSRLERQDAGST
jgi:hypothetical protein